MTSLTDLIADLSIEERLEVRRRIEEIADHFARKIILKHGANAKPHVMRRIKYCANHAKGLRWHVWSIVYGMLPDF